MELKDIELGVRACDRVTGLFGKVTAKVERICGDHQVLLEAIDSTGRPIEQWVQVNRIAGG